MSNYKITLGEFGQTLRFNVKEDLTLYTDVTLSFTAPNSPSIIKGVLDGVTVSGQEVTVLEYGVSKRYLANQYVDYVIEDGLFNKVGQWRIRLTASSPALKKITQYVTVDVIS